MSGEPMVLKVVNKINGKLKLLYRKNKFLTPALRRMQCAYSATFWLPAHSLEPKSYKKKTKKEIQIMQNKCIRFCLRLVKMQHISLAKFRLINWISY